MATVRKAKSAKSRPSRRQVLQAAVAAPLAAGLAAGVQGEPLRKNNPKRKTEDSLGADASSKLRLSANVSEKRSADSVSANVSESFAPCPDFTPFDLFVAVVTAYGDSRVALATMDQREAERFVTTFTRMNAGGHSVASMQCVRVSAPGIKAEVFAAVIEREGKPPEVCGVAADKQFSEAFAFTWNKLSTKEGHDSQARVVRGVATFGGQV